MKTLQAALATIVEGELNELTRVLAANQIDLLVASAKLPQLTISRAALIRVLKAWKSGCFTTNDVQQWASFVRRGYASGKTGGPVHSIDIEYDPNDEELIVQIIGRFDAIGDTVDGEIDDNEQEEMLRVLEA